MGVSAKAERSSRDAARGVSGSNPPDSRAATARSCQFVENSGSLPGDAGNGGAVLVGDMYDPLAAASFVAEDCVFRGNYGGEGGAVFVGQYSTFDCVGCVFEANIAAAGSGNYAGGPSTSGTAPSA